MKTDELTGAALDWAVAKCEGVLMRWERSTHDEAPLEYSPSTDWAQGGPIIERERMGGWYCDAVIESDGTVDRDKCYYAEDKDGDHVQTGPTPLITYMRCYVASKLGDEIELPKELNHD
jgi:hypothetical protein